ncbi:Hypothetical predicted protein, partial [Marmota monax]
EKKVYATESGPETRPRGKFQRVPILVRNANVNDLLSTELTEGSPARSLQVPASSAPGTRRVGA